MLEAERWRIVVEEARRRGTLDVGAIGTLTGASPATVRRDVARLAAQGLVRRVRGGLEATERPARRPLARAAEKRAIARAAVALCADGETIIVNGGTTTAAMAEFLADRSLHILTNAIAFATTLIETSGNRVEVPGGEIFREQGIILSPFDSDATRHFAASKMFMGCHALTAQGVIESDPLIARAEAKLLDRAADLVILADASKFQPRGSMAVCDLARVRTLITDDAAPESALDMARAAGIEVIVVSP